MSFFKRVYGVTQRRVFWGETSKKAFRLALLNCLITVITGLLFGVEAEKLTWILVVSAFLSGVIEFLSTLREFYKNGQESSGS